MENKNTKKEDFELMKLELMDLKFNIDGYELICDYVEEKLRQDGISFKIDEASKKGEFEKTLIDYSMSSKREGIKEMVRHVLSTGEERGLNGNTKLGVWLNHAVEVMSMRIINIVLKDVEEIAEKRITSVYMAQCFQESEDNKKNDLVSSHKMSQMWERMCKNIKQIKYDSFLRFNRYVW